MTVPMRRCSLRAFMIALATFALTGCDCDLVGCQTGLSVYLSSVPLGPVQIALIVDGVPTGEVAESDCTLASTCRAGAVFPFTPSHATVKVTTGAGVRFTEFASIKYVQNQPNGDGCDPKCSNASVTAQVP